MTDSDREALVERMTKIVAEEATRQQWGSISRAGQMQWCDRMRAALAVAEPVVREWEREACITTARKALNAYGRWHAAITPDTLMAKIEPVIRAMLAAAGETKE